MCLEDEISITTDKAPIAMNAVQLSTYHSAKGREFEYVYMPTLVRDKWESSRKSMKSDRLCRRNMGLPGCPRISRKRMGISVLLNCLPCMACTGRTTVAVHIPRDDGVQALWGSFVEVGLHFEFWSFPRFWKEARRLLLIIEGRHYKGDETSLREQDSHASFWSCSEWLVTTVFRSSVSSKTESILSA